MNHFNTNEILHAHSYAVFDSLDSLIENGFNDVNAYNYQLSELLKIHPNIRGNDVRRICDIISEYLLQTMKKQKTNTLEIALHAFFNHISHAFETHHNYDDKEDDEDEPCQKEDEIEKNE